jgi:hypothetical protein
MMILDASAFHAPATAPELVADSGTRLDGGRAFRSRKNAVKKWD